MNIIDIYQVDAFADDVFKARDLMVVLESEDDIKYLSPLNKNIQAYGCSNI